MNKQSQRNKKILSLFLVFLFLFSLTGCITEKNREKIIEALGKYKVIQKDWTFLSYRGNDASPIPDISSYSYYYQDHTGMLYEVCIQNKYPETEEHGEYYPVSVTNNMESFENEEFYTDPDYEERQKHIVTRYRTTKASRSTHYRVSRHKLFIFDIWVVKKESSDQ